MSENNRVSIDVLELSVRSTNALFANDILFIDQLENITAEEMIGWKNIGKFTIREVRKELARYGTCLKNDYVASSQKDREIIENIPNLIKEIQWEVGRLENRVKSLYDTLDLLHMDMRPKP